MGEVSLLAPDHRLALFMEGAFAEDTGKLGISVLRYSQNHVVALIDSQSAPGPSQGLTGVQRDCPVVGTVAEAKEIGADVLVLGTAPAGGLIPDAWWPSLDEAVRSGMSIVNGMHARLASRYGELRPGQFVWDVRQEPDGLAPGSGSARQMRAKRVLFIGTDMSVGKMTAALEVHRAALAQGIKAAFVATGQCGIVIAGSGVPLDAVRLDFASGAIEREVVCHGSADLILVEGQGSLLHPASSATLPLIRGSCPTHLVLCHRAGMGHLRRVPWVAVPDLRKFAQLYEDLAAAVGSFARPKTVALCLNTAELTDKAAHAAVKQAAQETGWAVSDPVRFGATPVLNALLS